MRRKHRQREIVLGIVSKKGLVNFVLSSMTFKPHGDEVA